MREAAFGVFSQAVLMMRRVLARLEAAPTRENDSDQER